MASEKAAWDWWNSNHIHVIKDCLPAILPSLTPGGGGGVHLPFGLENRWSNLDTKAGDHDIPNNNSRIDFTTPCPFLSL